MCASQVRVRFELKIIIENTYTRASKDLFDIMNLSKHLYIFCYHSDIYSQRFV